MTDGQRSTLVRRFTGNDNLDIHWKDSASVMFDQYTMGNAI